MQFKIGETDVKISFTFFAVMVLYFIDDYKKTVIASVITCTIHELIHLLFLIIYKCKIHKFTISLFGGNIIRKQSQKTSLNKEIVINVSAPVFNIIAGVILWVINKNSIFAQVNLVLGIFNILPFYNFDGGVALYCFLCKYFSQNLAEKVITATSFIILLIFTAFTLIISIFNEINISLLLINMYFITFFLYKIFNNSTCFA